MNSIQRTHLGGVHTRRGLVQQKDLRADASARRSQFSPVAVRQVLGEFFRDPKGKDERNSSASDPVAVPPVESPGKCGGPVPDVRVVGDRKLSDDRQFAEDGSER